MHILLIHQYFLGDDEGGGSRWNEMARIWINSGHSVTVLTGSVHYMTRSRGRKWFDKSVNKDGVTVIRCHVSNSYHSSFVGRLFSYFSFALSALFGGLFFAKDHYDCILVTSPPLFAGIPALLLSKIKQIPLVTEIRDLWPESAVETGILKNVFLIRLAYRFERLLYQKSKRINVLTPAFREVLINKGLEASKIMLIPNAADFTLSEKAEQISDLETVRIELGLEDEFLIIYVGAHGVANGLSQVVEAAALLESQPVHFLLVGDGAEKQMLLDTVRQLGLTNITFKDPVSKADVFRYIFAADAGLSVLKKAEVFKTVYSNKTFDYLSCKKPVLMAIDGISRQLIEEANAGLFIEPENAEDSVKQILTYLNNPELARLHGENGYCYARQHFDREQLAREYLLHLEKVTVSSSF